ncbi:Voltage-gated Ion Channel (VIC) Superfamily [Phytophthora cinnamomi]|uniref:Voltage-gated Ion Channel (VIC) Superfamily n=1 Tax=Phytophthora cinnamomi TaxID=4785 RepID=UPI00355A8405|nr:Voltage-gated Ion Channel (VIC) Superfamily [Phytophthora cinnamomi]
MGSTKGPSSDTNASSRVVPEGETAKKEAPPAPSGEVEIPTPEREAELLAKLASLIVSSDALPAVSADPSTALGPVLPQIILKAPDKEDGETDNNEAVAKATRANGDGVLNAMQAIEFTEQVVNHHSWRVVSKLAILAKSMNAHTIDIYHDRKLNTSRFMIHPNSKLRRAWEITTVCLVVYVCTVIPFIIGFQFIDWGRLNGMNTFIDVYFITDMAMTLRTGIVSNGEVVMDPKKVAHKYFHSWFIVDLISNFPLVLFMPASGKSLKIVKLQKIPKLLRIGRLLKYLREYAKYYNLIVSFLGLAMGLHLFACLWASLFNECYGDNGEEHCGEGDLAPMYVQCIHIIMLMFLGIGESTTYSSIAKLRNPEVNANIQFYYMSIAIFMLGTVFSSFFFGNVLALLMSWDQQKAQFRNRMDMIKAEMKYYELPEELQHRVRRNYDYLWINQRAYSDMMLLNQPGISRPLKTTIALHLYKDLVKTVPFFAGSDSRFLGKVCLALETAVYLPGDTIIYCDDIGKEMFIVRKGLVEILIPDCGNSDKRIYLRDGNFFGETALVIDVRRTNTVRAVNICDLNVLSKHAFNEIVAEYPEFGERMKRTVIKRQLDNMNIQSPTGESKGAQSAHDGSGEIDQAAARTLDLPAGPRRTLDLPNGSRRTIDSISRKLSRTELTLDLIPAALADITSMVEQIRQTTELLSLRLGSSEAYDDDDHFDDTFGDDLALALNESPLFPPVTEETEEEMARRESNSIFVPSANGSKTSSRTFSSKRGSGISKHKDAPKKG